MNKIGFIKSLQEKTNLSSDKCILVNDVLENHFLIGKKNKDRMKEDLKKQLKIGEQEAEELYIISMDILKDSLKEKLKHPFGSNQDFK